MATKQLTNWQKEILKDAQNSKSVCSSALYTKRELKTLVKAGFLEIMDEVPSDYNYRVTVV